MIIIKSEGVKKWKILLIKKEEYFHLLVEQL